MGYERITLYDMSALLLAYGAGCILTVFCCGFEALCRLFVGCFDRRPTVQSSDSMSRTVCIDLQSTDGRKDVHFEYLLNDSVDLNILKQEFDNVVRRHRRTRI